VALSAPTLRSVRSTRPFGGSARALPPRGDRKSSRSLSLAGAGFRPVRRARRQPGWNSLCGAPGLRVAERAVCRDGHRDRAARGRRTNAGVRHRRAEPGFGDLGVGYPQRHRSRRGHFAWPASLPAKLILGVIHQDHVVLFQHRQQDVLEFTLPKVALVKFGFHRVA
jgi:hypothetical protein